MRVLVITGSMGSGKTTMMGEVSDLLAMRGTVHAAIDIDAFGNVHDPAGAIDLAAMAYRNVAAAVRNYAAEGVTTLVMAGAIETRAELAQLRGAVGATDLVVCRLRAPLAIMQQRVRAREPGIWQQKYVDRVAVLEEALDHAALEDVSVVNDGSRPVTNVAREILQRAGWAPPSSD
jgi:type II secretory pathway predicted ATPase ExeA